MFPQFIIIYRFYVLGESFTDVHELKKEGDLCGKNACKKNSPDLGHCVEGLTCRYDWAIGSMGCGHGKCLKGYRKNTIRGKLKIIFVLPNQSNNKISCYMCVLSFSEIILSKCIDLSSRCGGTESEGGKCPSCCIVPPYCNCIACESPACNKSKFNQDFIEILKPQVITLLVVMIFKFLILFM